MLCMYILCCLKHTQEKQSESVCYLYASVTCGGSISSVVRSLATPGFQRRVQAAAIHAGKTGERVAAVVHEVFEHGEILHAEHDGGREGGGVRGDVGVDISTVFYQQDDGPHAALPQGYEQRAEGVQVGVGTGLQQHTGGVDVVIDYREVESGTAAVLVHGAAILRQRGVDVEAGVDEQLEDLVSVSLCGKMERTDPATSHAGLTGSRDEHRYDSGAQIQGYQSLRSYSCT